MDCTAAILKACARSRTKWCRHERSSVRRPGRPAGGCSCSGNVAAVRVGGRASSLLQHMLFYACCCLSHEDGSDRCPEWYHRPSGAQGGGKREEEGEREGLPPSLSLSFDVLVQADRFPPRSNPPKLVLVELFFRICLWYYCYISGRCGLL